MRDPERVPRPRRPRSAAEPRFARGAAGAADNHENPPSDGGGRRVEDPRRVLARHGLHAKKSWGQNFLHDRSVHARIVAAAALTEDDVVVDSRRRSRRRCHDPRA
jgi:hypothetical protein